MKHQWLALAIVVACVGSAAAAPSPPPGPSASEMKWMSMHGPQNPDGLPKGVSAVLGCIPTMGYHYANLKDLPFGPIYGWYDGKPTFTEIMVDQKLFESGKSWDEQLKPLPGYHIDHVDIWFEPHGHPGYPIPHYDIHAWYIPHAEHMTECGNKSGKKPAWLGS
ncbi:MAG TPA: hypothetical protein VFO25_09330 [Candidatus Eremiobacteraceae bacterium]|nr:hypothetical protein [Candidatus Eremiobacteraceae bacterium]